MLDLGNLFELDCTVTCSLQAVARVNLLLVSNVPKSDGNLDLSIQVVASALLKSMYIMK